MFFLVSSQQLLSRPPIPSHQVPPYRAVSARFRPSALSQSTPIGLDGVGRRQLHRVLSGENYWGCCWSQMFIRGKAESENVNKCVGGKCCCGARCGCDRICALFSEWFRSCQNVICSIRYFIFLTPVHVLQSVCLSARRHLMTAWVKRRRAALMPRPTSSQGWSSLCSTRYGWGGKHSSPKMCIELLMDSLIWLYACLVDSHVKMSSSCLTERTTTAVPTSRDISGHVRRGLSLHVIVFLSYLCVFLSVDKLRPQGVCWGSLGPCDHGGAGASLQGWRCYPCLGCLA